MTPEQGKRYQFLKQKIARWEKLSPEEQLRRRRVWAHNGLLGHVGMAKHMTNTVLGSTTATETAKQIAADIRVLLDLLDIELRNRRK